MVRGIFRFLRVSRRCLPNLVFLLALAACSGLPPAAQVPSPVVLPSATLIPTGTATPTATPYPTLIPTQTPTLVPTFTATVPAVLAGTPLPPVSEPIVQANLERIRQLAQWGRGRVQDEAWSPDGRWIAVSTTLGVYLYSFQEDLTLAAHIDTRAQAYEVAFSPSSGLLAVDTRLAGAGASEVVPPHRVQVWDLSGGEPLLRATLQTGAPALALRFSGEGELGAIIQAGGGAQFQRWAFTGADGVFVPSVAQPLQQINLTGGETAVSAAIAPDLTLAAAHGEDGPVRLWRLRDGVNLATTRETGMEAGPMEFSPDSRSLAIGYADRTTDFQDLNQVKVWRLLDSSPFVELQHSLRDFDLNQAEGAQRSLISVAWSADGSRVAAGYADHAVAVWSLDRPWAAQRRFSASTLPSALAWSPEGERLASGGLEVWSLAAAGEDDARIAYDDDYLPGLYDMRFTADGGELALASFSRIDFRSALDGRITRAITGMSGPVNGIAINPDGDLLAAACQDGTIRLYSAGDGRYLAQLGAPTYPQRSVDFSSNGWWLAAAGDDMLVRVFRVDTGELLYSAREPYVSYRLAFEPNSNQLTSLTTQGMNLRAASGSRQRMTLNLQGVVGGVGLSDMAYSPGAEFLAAAGGGAVRVVDPLTLDDVYSLSRPGGVLPFSVAFSPDNAFLAVGWSDGWLRLYWAQTGSLMHEWPAHPGVIERLAFTRDGRLLASLGAEGTVRIWGVAE